MAFSQKNIWQFEAIKGWLNRRPMQTGTTRPDAQHTRQLVLYLSTVCPFCVTVLRAIRKLNLSIETRDILRSPSYRNELTDGGGVEQVPCLRIIREDGEDEWLYESGDIVQYLTNRFK